MNLVPVILHRSADAKDADWNEIRQRPKRVKKVEDTSVMYNDYDWKCHQFVTHLRRSHIMMPVEGFEGQCPWRRRIPWLSPACPFIIFTARRKFTTTFSFISGIMLWHQHSLSFAPGLLSTARNHWTHYFLWSLKIKIIQHPPLELEVLEHNIKYYEVMWIALDVMDISLVAWGGQGRRD